MKNKQGFIERIEDGWALIRQVDRSCFRVKSFILPPHAGIGVFIVETKKKGEFIIENRMTELRRQEVSWISDCCWN